jgi:hypothetical protein
MVEDAMQMGNTARFRGAARKRMKMGTYDNQGGA